MTKYRGLSSFFFGEDTVKSMMLAGRFLLVGLVAGQLISCSSENNPALTGGGGVRPTAGGGGSAQTGGQGGTNPGGGGADTTGEGGSQPVDDAGAVDDAAEAGPVNDGGAVDESDVSDHAAADSGAGGPDAIDEAAPPVEEEAAVIPARGPGVLFSFDSDDDFRTCDPNAIIPPCWQSQIDSDAGGPSGTLMPVADDAIAGHLPPRALEWTAVFPGYDVNVRLGATFARNEDWTARTRLHLSVRVTSGFSSLRVYQLFVQGGVEASYGSIYTLGTPADLDPALPSDADGSTFRDLSIDLTAPDINRTTLTAVAGIGIVLRSVAATAPPDAGDEPLTTEIPDGGDGAPATDLPDAGDEPPSIDAPDGGDEPQATDLLHAGDAPPPIVIEIDNIWLE
jgi:hypothetical protein